MVGVKYALREQVADAPDIRAAAYATGRIDSVLESASRDIEKLLHYRWLFPMTATLTFDYPDTDSARYGRLWLADTPLLSLTGTVSGGVSIPASQYALYPNGAAFFNRLELSQASSFAWAAGATYQQALSITGVFGISADEESSGTLTAAITTTAQTTITVSTNVGVGRLLRIDNERLLVTDKTYVTSGQTCTLANVNSATAMSVADGTQFSRGEEIYADSERMLVQDVVGNTVIVQRATGGTVLAAHTTATIFYGRQLTVQRAAAGTTAATHLNAAPILRWVIPGPINELCIAYAVWRLLQRGTGWARTVGSNEGERIASGRGIADLEAQVYGGYARKGRVYAV